MALKENSPFPAGHRIAIVGAGLVGSLLSIYLAKKGFNVSVFERRADMRTAGADHGRSINLALSARGILALEEVGLAEALKKVAIPMHGRTMHDGAENLSFLPYGTQGQYINSISRSDLNIVLMNRAEAEGVKLYFNHRVIKVDTQSTSIEFQGPHSGPQKFDGIIGADGAFSAVRWGMQTTDRFDYSQDYIDHGYKEFHIPASASGQFQFEKNSLHIWPRESFMLIALPNPDGSFTATLFFPFEGNTSFQSLTNDDQIKKFFEQVFPDAFKLMPDLLADFKNNPTSSLLTVKCFPWVKNNTFLLGDAAHAIVPFYGQGMNAGFEDCSVFSHLLDKYPDDWAGALLEFQNLRKPDADAIAQLALENFVEMRDLVTDADFLLQKRIEAKLHELYPDRWIPLYSMVTFHTEIRYSEALRKGLRQKEIMSKVMQTKEIHTRWMNLDFEGIVEQL